MDDRFNRGWFKGLRRLLDELPSYVAWCVNLINRTWVVRALVIVAFMVGTLFGIRLLLPPLDYLPKGNRNLIFGLMIPPPGYNLEQLSRMAERVETVMKPSWEAAPDQFKVEKVLRDGASRQTLKLLRNKQLGYDANLIPTNEVGDGCMSA